MTLADSDITRAEAMRSPTEDATSRLQERVSPHQLVRSAIKERCLVTSADGPLLSPSGSLQNWMIDLRPLFLDAIMLARVAGMFLHKFSDRGPYQIAGMEVAAIPLIIGIALRSVRSGAAINACIIRKERKSYGLGKAIEGSLNDHPVILVDDILNSGSSMEKARVALAREGKTVREAFVLIDYRSRKGLAWRKKHGIKVISLFTLTDFDLSLAADKVVPKRDWAMLWQFSADGASPFHIVPKSTPILEAGRLYFGTDSDTFWCLDAETGRPIWSFKAEGSRRKGIWSSPAYHGGRIYFGGYNGDLYCLDAVSGRELWRNPACDWIGSSPCVVDKHRLVVVGLEYKRPSAKGSMAAFCLTSGEKLWERPMTRFQHGSATYWPEGDLVICGNSDHSILAQHAKSGETAWEYPTERSIKYPPAIDLERRLVVAASFDGYIYIVRLDTGEFVTKFKTNNMCYTTPLISHGRVFCGSGDKHLYVVDLDSMSLVDKIYCGSRVYGSPRLNNGAVGFGCNGGVYREVNPLTLAPETYLQLPDAITNAINISNDGKTIYVPTYMNEIYAFRRTT